MKFFAGWPVTGSHIMRTVLKICVVCFGLSLMLLRPSEATQAVAPFTTGEGPATVETCTPKALGAHPHPALLAACLYVPFLGNPEVWETQDKANRLLSRYATFTFFDLLEKNYKWAQQGRGGISTFGIFFSDEGVGDFEITGSTFDPESGLVILSTLNDHKPYSYRILFVVENGLWRVDDIHLFHHGCKIPKHIKEMVAKPGLWFRQLSHCGKR
jgi:hypothetical protein